MRVLVQYICSAVVQHILKSVLLLLAGPKWHRDKLQTDLTEGGSERERI